MFISLIDSLQYPNDIKFYRNTLLFLTKTFVSSVANKYTNDPIGFTIIYNDKFFDLINTLDKEFIINLIKSNIIDNQINLSNIILDLINFSTNKNITKLKFIDLLTLDAVDNNYIYIYHRLKMLSYKIKELLYFNYKDKSYNIPIEDYFIKKIIKKLNEKPKRDRYLFLKIISIDINNIYIDADTKVDIQMLKYKEHSENYIFNRKEYQDEIYKLLIMKMFFYFFYN